VELMDKIAVSLLSWLT